MSLPADARVQAARPFVLAVRAQHAFLREQDAARADTRYAGLLSRLKRARGQLGANPAMGRPARFADAGTPRSRALLAEVTALALAQGLPQLRELVIAPYLLLYAHDDRRVMLLSLRHTRQLAYTLR